MSLASLLAATLIAGCGSAASHAPNTRELALQRAQLVQVANELRALESAVQREVATSRGAWPQIANGLPRALSPSLRSEIASANASAGALPEPRFIAQSSKLTGPAAGIAGLYESYARLAQQGWRLTAAGIASILEGAPAAAGFARENSALYIDAIYDAHFDLSLLGKSVVSGYEKLGGSPGFGAGLTQAQVGALAAAYSIPAVRLEPHPGRTVAEG
jgi:hypothetical protein